MTANVKEFMQDRTRVLSAVGVAALAVLIILGLYYAAKDQANWEAWCEGQGGVVDSVTKTGVGTGVTGDGKTVTTTTTSTTHYCLVDGGIIDVR